MTQEELQNYLIAESKRFINLHLIIYSVAFIIAFVYLIFVNTSNQVEQDRLSELTYQNEINKNESYIKEQKAYIHGLKDGLNLCK